MVAVVSAQVGVVSVSCFSLDKFICHDVHACTCTYKTKSTWFLTLTYNWLGSLVGRELNLELNMAGALSRGQGAVGRVELSSRTYTVLGSTN